MTLPTVTSDCINAVIEKAGFLGPEEIIKDFVDNISHTQPELKVMHTFFLNNATKLFDTDHDKEQFLLQSCLITALLWKALTTQAEAADLEQTIL